MKNIGKPCAGEPHARFDEGGQARACSLLYPLIFHTRWPKAIASKSLRTWMKQEQNGEIKASVGANKLTADQLRIREIIGVWSALVPREKITPTITFYES